MPSTRNEQIIVSWDAAQDDVEVWSDAGDFAHRYLIMPAILDVLGDCSGLRIMDGGCGGGYLARILARQGAIATGIEPAPRLFDLCIQRERADPLHITYIQQDLCEFAPPEQPFDSVVLNMTLMDIADYARAIAACARSLAPGGRLIISMLHPCFDEEPMSAWPEQRRVFTTAYFDESERPQTHTPFFHRPLSAYIDLLIESGLSLSRVVEPRLADAEASTINGRDLHVPTFLVIQADMERTR